MQKAAPSFGRVAIMAGFALSCFGLLLFLWLAFGGNIPLKPKGYRFTASFSEATQLAQEADVRDRKSTRMNSSHTEQSRMPSSA